MAALKAATDMLRQMREEDARERRALAEAVSELRTEVARLSARIDALASESQRECRPGNERLASLEEWRARADASLRVWRDWNRDCRICEGGTDEGMFGIHIHKAGKSSVQVDRWSAGCQVLAREADFDRMMELYDASAALYGPRITYTLLTERDFS